MKVSLQYKFLAAFLAVVILVLAGVSTGSAWLIREYIMQGKKRELADRARFMVRVMNDYYDGHLSYAQLVRQINRFDTLLDVRIWVLDNDLKLIAASVDENVRPHNGPGKAEPLFPRLQGQEPREENGMGLDRRQRMMRNPVAVPQPAPPQAEIAEIPLGEIKGMKPLADEVRLQQGREWGKVLYHPYFDEYVLMAAVPAQRPDGALAGTILLYTPLVGIEKFLRQIYWYVAASGVAAFVLSALVVNYLAGGIVRQLRAMQRTARAIAQGDYTARALVETRDEVGELGQSLNELAQELQDYVGRLEVQDRMRREFVANVSHELKTPVTILRGYHAALADGTIENPTEQEKYRRIMGEEIQRMEKLIAELLDLSLLQADGTAIEKERLSLAEIVDNVQLLLEQRSTTSGVVLAVAHDAGEAEIFGDGNRIIQLLLILVDNALKFTPPGGRIEIGLGREGEMILLSVADTGKGIPAEDLPYIWERFYKGDKSRQRAAGGTGLGLAIAREIIHLHGATVEVSSTTGSGTRFVIRFPAVKEKGAVVSGENRV